MIFKCRKSQKVEKYNVSDSSVNIICTTTFPQVRDTTNTLCVEFIKELNQNDIMMLSGVYVDLDLNNPEYSILNELTQALKRGAKILIFTDPSLDKERTYDNSVSLRPLLENGAYWFSMGTGGFLQSHIKLCDFIYFSKTPNQGIFYYGSYNPFAPVTSEAGIFVQGFLTQPIIRQSIFRNKTFFKTYLKLDNHYSDPAVLQQLVNQLETYSSVPDSTNTIEYASVIYPKNSISQCVSTNFTHLQPSVFWKNTEDINYPVSSLKYSIGFMPEIQNIGPSAKTNLLYIFSRAQKYIKMALLFDHFSDEIFGPDNFKTDLMNVLKDAFKRGVFITLYVGVYNLNVQFLDKPQYSKFINYITDGKPQDTFRLFVYPSYSLHFKFYVTEKDVLISNNMPESSFYEETIQGVDICFYECPELNAFFDNTFNGFISTFSDNLNELYLQDGAVYSIPIQQIATRTNLLLCGEGCFMGEMGCCLPEKHFPFRTIDPKICKISFVPSYVDEPYNPINFYMVMLYVINSAEKFIILVNEFTHLGCDDSYFDTLDDWNKTTERKAINTLFYNALKDALNRGVLIYIVSSKGSQNITLPDGTTIVRLKDTLTPSLKKISPQQVFGVDVDNLNYIYYNSMDIPTKAINGAGSYIHDKLYVSDKHAYVGGQNWYCPLELDAGFLFGYGPIYFDLRSRAQSLTGLGYSPMTYTQENPFKGSIIDMITGYTYTGSVYPCISPQLPNGDATPFSILSYNPNYKMTSILNAYLSQLEQATGNVDIFCWTMSPVEFYVQDKNKTPYFVQTEFIDAIIRISKKPEVESITFVMCIHSFKNELLEYKNADIDLYCTGRGLNRDVYDKYKQAYDELYELLNLPKVKLYVQGITSDKVPTNISSCNLFHAKVIASSNSISTSSANFTPGYFFSASNTGVVVNIPLANQITGFQDFRKRIFDLENKKCIENCGTELDKPCLKLFVPNVKLKNFCDS
jgi:hypothetical protein